MAAAAHQLTGEVIPTNFGLKYSPPTLGVQYYFKENSNPSASFVHEIELTDLEPNSDIKDLTKNLFANNSTFLNQK